jgi:copper chaperone NosL
MTRNQKYTLGVAVFFMALALWLPLWQIEIWAPQYPEGLSMQISAGSIDGNVSQINILNHYIGMKHIVPDQIPELKIIPRVLGALVLLGILVIFVSRIFWAKIWMAAIALTSAAGLYDFYRWGYDYGHNLSPDAPIKMPGFSYQPPLFGYKKILNIEAYSLPDWGTYALSAGILLVLCAIYWDFLRGLLKNSRAKILALSFFLGACTAKVAPLLIGVDHCDNCHMQLTDARFGAELITEKGRVYKFDSIHCLREYLAKHSSEKAKQIFVIDYFQPGKLISTSDAYFLSDASLEGPMGDSVAASANKVALENIKTSSSRKVVDWEKLSGSAY